VILDEWNGEDHAGRARMVAVECAKRIVDTPAWNAGNNKAATIVVELAEGVRFHVVVTLEVRYDVRSGEAVPICTGCGCRLAKTLGGLEHHVEGCKFFPL
jgi:hypothetical protein